MKTYTKLIKHKIHWLHLAAVTLIIGFFTSVSLQQFAAQVYYSSNYYPGLTKSEIVYLHQTGVLKMARKRLIEEAAKPVPVPPAPAQTPVTSAQVASTNKSTQTKKLTSTSSSTTPTPTPTPTYSSDIAPETVCPGQSSIASTTSVLPCMAAYARAAHGIVTISANSSLMAAAQAKIQDMQNCGYSHTACGHPFNYWFSIKGYTGHCAAENIAQGQATPGQVFVAWMNSSGHRANILNPLYNAIGVAEGSSSGGNLWAMELGGC